MNMIYELLGIEDRHNCYIILVYAFFPSLLTNACLILLWQWWGRVGRNDKDK